MNVYAVIVTYNPDIVVLNKSILALITQVNKIIIVDNCSTNDFFKKLIKYSKIILIKNEDNFGVAYALNKGVSKCLYMKADWVLTLDQDSIIGENYISKMLSAYQKIYERDKVGMLCPQYFINGKDNKHIIYNDDIYFVGEAITSGSLVKASIFNKVGMYDDSLFIDCVDYEFCLRLKMNGYRIAKVNSSILYHSMGIVREKKLFNKVIKYTTYDYLRRYYRYRNRIHIYKKNFFVSPSWVMKDLVKFFKEIIKIIITEKDWIFHLKFILIGIIDGVRGKRGKMNYTI
ncbi:MAG: glycosyltransferase family 2 protein [Candidatus Marinimicrobia bacterium]|nr:glycosyltransferase family 2 protein [Candidatus Neomarinimicrobiota bacterium]